jgi:hypothetical protein
VPGLQRARETVRSGGNGVITLKFYMYLPVLVVNKNMDMMNECQASGHPWCHPPCYLPLQTRQSTRQQHPVGLRRLPLPKAALRRARCLHTPPLRRAKLHLPSVPATRGTLSTAGDMKRVNNPNYGMQRRCRLEMPTDWNNATVRRVLSVPEVVGRHKSCTACLSGICSLGTPLVT